MAIIKGNKWCSFWWIAALFQRNWPEAWKAELPTKCVFGIMKLMPFGTLMFLYFIHEAVQKQIFITPPELIQCATVHNWLMNAWLNTVDVRIWCRKQHCTVNIIYTTGVAGFTWSNGEIHYHQLIFYFDLFWVQDESQSIQKLWVID